MEVRELVTKLGFNVDSSKLKSFEGQISSVRNSMTVAVGVISAFGASLFYLTKHISDMGDELAKNSARIGLSIADLQKYSYAAELAGTNIETFRNGITRFSRNLLDSKLGTGEALKAFETLKLDPKNFKDTNDAFLKIADRFKGMKNGYEKTAIAQQLFGKSGAQLINLLNEGSESIKNQGLELQDLGAIISEDFARTSEDFNDSMLRMKTFILGLKITLAEELMPLFNDIMHDTIAWAKVNKEFIKIKIREYAEKFVDAIRFLIRNVRTLSYLLGGLASAWAIGGLINIFNALLPLFGLIKTVTLFLTGSAILPWTLLAAAIGTVALTIQDLHTGLSGGNSEFMIKNADDLKKSYSRFGVEITNIIISMQELLRIFEGKNETVNTFFASAFDLSQTAITKIKTFFVTLFTEISSYIKESITNALFDTFSFIASKMETIGKVANFASGFSNFGALSAIKSTVPTANKVGGNTVEQNIEFKPEINVNMNGTEGGMDIANKISEKIRDEASRMFRNTKRDLETAGV